MRNYQWLSVVEKKSYLNSRSLTWFDNFGRSEKRFFFSVIHILGAQGEEIFQRRLYSFVLSRLWEEEWGFGGFTLTCSGAWFLVECTVRWSRFSAFRSQHALKFLGLRYAN